MSDGLLIGRSRVWLDPRTAIGGRHELFAAQLLDGATITGQTFEHCTFANVSFKGATLDRCEFVNCAFVDCYFRHTRIRNSSLGGRCQTTFSTAATASEKRSQQTSLVKLVSGPRSDHRL